MKATLLQRIPRLIFSGLLIAAIFYANTTDGWLGIGLFFSLLAVGWLFHICFPLFFRLDQMSRRESREESAADDV